MSQLRRVIALIVLALMGWFVAFGTVGAVTASASAQPAETLAVPPIACC
jgi:hypothetical protein